MKKSIEFYANGKLLITGEYLVLAGALALALPVRFGQKILICESGTGIIDWESSDPDGTWFTAKFDPVSFRIISCSNLKKAASLKSLLAAARKLNTLFLSETGGLNVFVKANYPLKWGLGSSSTLCWLVAGWAGVDVFQLFRLISSGSGYDIACADRKDLIYYRLKDGIPEVVPARAGSALRQFTYFGYLGNKQNSLREVTSFISGKNYSGPDLDMVSQLSCRICLATSPDELISLVDEHESIIGRILKRKLIRASFPAFPGTVKSLGAWGGDFAMFVSMKEPGEVREILYKYGFTTIYTFSELQASS